MVAINTTPQTAAPTTRAEALEQWMKRTQEILAYRRIRGQTFSQLYNLLRTKRLAEIALANVLRNAGARTAGVDGITREDLKSEERRRQLVEEINRELCGKTYRPRPVRRVYILKDNGDQRGLGIPTLKDRVVQEMLRLILEPIYECRFYAHSYGFRPYRSAHQAAMRLKFLIGRHGYNIAIEGDIRKCFDRIHHAQLLGIVRKTIKDERVVKVIAQMLTAGVMEDGAWQVTEEGTPQGGIVSPLLANIYLNELDRYLAAKWDWVNKHEKERQQKRKSATSCYIVRYADDFVIAVKGTMAQAEQIKADVASYLAQELHLELSAEKTLITEVTKGFDFLGFNIRRYGKVTLVTPSRKAMQKFRTKVKAKAAEGFAAGAAAGIVHLNRFLLGWGMYYRRVNSGRHFRKCDHYVWWRVFRTTYRKSGRKVPVRQYYMAHYIPYRYDIRVGNRRHRGRNYGAWADATHTKAHIVMRLTFIPIRYAWVHPQLNPYVPAERQKLERVVGTLEPPPDRLPGPSYHSEYGLEWPAIRREVLQAAGHRCQMCNRHIVGRDAHVHHRTKLKDLKRKQANLVDNLVALCAPCHSKAERGLP